MSCDSYCAPKLTRGTVTSFEVATYVAAPSAPTVTPQGTPGASTVTYRIEAVDADGNVTEAGSAGSTSTANATLNGTNYNGLTWAVVPGAASYRVHRTAGGPSQGLIGTPTSNSLNDTGLAATAATLSSANGTGKGESISVIDALADKTVQVSGTFADLRLEGSLDGTNWTEIHQFTAAGAHSFSQVWDKLRIRSASYSAGPATAMLMYQTER